MIYEDSGSRRRVSSGGPGVVVAGGGQWLDQESKGHPIHLPFQYSQPGCDMGACPDQSHKSPTILRHPTPPPLSPQPTNHRHSFRTLTPVLKHLDLGAFFSHSTQAIYRPTASRGIYEPYSDAFRKSAPRSIKLPALLHISSKSLSFS